MTYSVVKENIIEKFSRALKVFEYGAKTADVVAPFGDDSAPLKDMIAIYSQTDVNGDSVIIGYFNKNQISEPGEKRIFSLKPDGSLSFSLHLRNDGTCEIGGNVDNAVRFSPLNTSLQNNNAAINQELEKIAIAINAIVPGSYSPIPLSMDLTSSKIEEIKTL